MKKKKLLLSVTVTVFTISLLFSSHVFSASSQPDWKSLYKSKVSQIENEYKQGKRVKDDTYDTLFFSLIDIDFDGVPELYHALISTKSGDYKLQPGTEEIYYIKNRNVVLGKIEAHNTLGLLPAYSISDTMTDRRGQFAFYSEYDDEAVMITKDSWIGSSEYGAVTISALSFDSSTGILKATELISGDYYRGEEPSSVDGYVFMRAASTYSVSRRKNNDLWSWEAPYIMAAESSQTSTATKDTNDWNNRYKQFVLNRQYEDTKQDYGTREPSRIKFGLHDMDGDGIPELIIHNGAIAEADMSNYVYMYENNSVSYLGVAGKGQSELTFSAGSGFPGLFWSSGTAGYYPGYYYHVKNNEIKDELVVEEKVEYYNGRMDYIKNQATDNDDLYYAYRNADSTLEMFSLSEINSVGWDNFVSSSLSHDNTLYSDVNLNSWFYEAVKFATEKNMMSGVSDKLFDPESKVTRSMFITMLYRLDGEPSTQSVSFKDVPKGSWYEKAIAWASRNNIANGVEKDLFAPDNGITREQLTAILYRYAKYKRKSVSTTDNTIKNYIDNNQISEYAVDPMNWAIENGLISGTSKTRLNPTGKATRAQAAVILQRFCNKFNF